MTAVVFNNQMKLPLDCEAALLHAACLLAGHTVAAGTTRQMFHHFKRLHATFEGKLSYLEGCFRPFEGFNEVKAAIKGCRDFKKFKHPPGHLIVAYKKLQKTIEAEYENQMGGFFRAAERVRLISIDALAPHGYFEPCHLADPRWPMPGEGSATAVEIAQLLPWQGKAAPALFLIPVDFFGDDVALTWPSTVNDPLPAGLESLRFLHSAFQLPSLGLLSLDELHAARTGLAEPAGDFHRAMEAWARACQQPEGGEDPVVHFEKEVVPAAQRFQAAMDESFVLNQHEGAGNDKRKLLFGISLMSPVAVWDLFHRADLLTEEDRAALRGGGCRPAV